MRFDIVTLFPELFTPHLAVGITRRAFERAPRPGPLAPSAPRGGSASPAEPDLTEPPQVDVRLWPLRDHAEGTYRRVDDRPFGGGPGMVMLAEPLERALAAVKADRGEPAPAVVHFTPTGERITQAVVREFAAGPGAILLCGRYEGIDQRLLDRHVTRELSLGDFVLSGGELPALALLDAVARLQPGVLTPQSHEQDSFSEDLLLDCPHYSRPELLQPADGSAPLPVPAVLLSGHHAQIARWRRDQQLAITARRRPDLIAAARAAGRLTAADERVLRGLSDAPPEAHAKRGSSGL